jgi:predicted dehydrogenase
MSLNVCIVGCGLIGQKRAKALGGSTLMLCVDLNLARAEQLAKNHQARATTDWQAAVVDPAVHMVVVATAHNSLAQIVRAAVTAGKHVLVEKPAAKRMVELAGLQALAEQNGVRVRVGFNHRYHRAFQQARRIVDSGALGPLMFVRARYGHGGRVGYDKEWRADADISGGGELIDQGVHLIDLAGWFLGDFVSTEGFAHTYFWDMPVDDNGFMLLKTAQNQVAFLHASCTEWKNTFSFEIYGKTGKLHIEGLGGSYGVERLHHYQMQPEMGPPPTTVYEYPMADNSWELEMAEFLADIEHKRTPQPGLREASAALAVVESVYAQSGFASNGAKR